MSTWYYPIIILILFYWLFTNESAFNILIELLLFHDIIQYQTYRTMQTYWLHAWYGIVYIMYIMFSIIDRSISSSDLNISIYFHYTYLYQASIATGLSQALGSPTPAKDCSMLQHLLQSGTVVPPWAQRLQARARCITGTIRLQSSHSPWWANVLLHHMASLECPCRSVRTQRITGSLPLLAYHRFTVSTRHSLQPCYLSFISMYSHLVHHVSTCARPCTVTLYQ